MRSLLAAAALGSAGLTHVALHPLTSGEITTALTGKVVAYSPPGWNDAGVSEEYQRDGRWGGIQYSRGPIPFSGKWAIKNNQLCVRPERAMAGNAGKHWLCRTVWRNAAGKLFMAHLTLGLEPAMGLGPMELSVDPLR